MFKLFKTLAANDPTAETFEKSAGADEWAVSGAFAFSKVTPQDTAEVNSLAFKQGFLSLESMGRASQVSVHEIDDHDRQTLLLALALHFLDQYEAPNMRTAKQVAGAELDFANDICGDHPVGTVLSVHRGFDEQNLIREEYRIISSTNSG